MKVLVIGSGGREHAIAWKLLQSSRVQTVYVAPGNGGTALDGRLHNVPLTDFNELAEFAVSEKIALTVVGPEGPLAAGIVDFFRARGLRIFGPTKAAAQLESSKAFSKAFIKYTGTSIILSAWMDVMTCLRIAPSLGYLAFCGTVMSNEWHTDVTPLRL